MGTNKVKGTIVCLLNKVKMLENSKIATPLLHGIDKKVKGPIPLALVNLTVRDEDGDDTQR